MNTVKIKAGKEYMGLWLACFMVASIFFALTPATPVAAPLEDNQTALPMLAMTQFCRDEPQGTLCPDTDGNECTEARCDDKGKCDQKKLIYYEFPCSDTDGNECTEARCDYKGKCDQDFILRPKGLPCLDMDEIDYTLPACDGEGSCDQSFVSYETCATSQGLCTDQHGSTGCEDTACCLAVCGIDPYCCEVEWDGYCVGLAVRCEQHPCDASSELCSEAHSSPGCSNTECCNDICDLQPSCCSGAWDESCVALAQSCDVQNCETAEDPECCRRVCEYDEYCCLNPSDHLCRYFAEELCGGHPCEISDEGCYTHPFPGCSDTETCRAVCELSPECCRGGKWSNLNIQVWNEVCAGEAAIFGSGIPNRQNCELAKLTAADAAYADFFGGNPALHDGFNAVVLSGNTAVIGAFGDDHAGYQAGAAYVFEYDGSDWVQQAKFTASDAAEKDKFGSSISISGDTIVIGAQEDDHVGASRSGSAYVFQKPVGGWVDMTETAKLTASDFSRADYFGNSVSISVDTIVVGAKNSGNSGFGNEDGSGAIYVFNKPPGGWTSMTETIKLIASDAAANDTFGAAVSISGEWILVAADTEGLFDDRYGIGAAYLFRDNGTAWVEEKKIIAPEFDTYSFAWSVALENNVAVISGRFGNGRSIHRSGYAYVYRFDGSDWVQEARLSHGGGPLFARSVSISGDRILAGSAWSDYNVTYRSGLAHLFRYDGSQWVFQAQIAAPDPWRQDEFGTAVSISGDVALIGAWGKDDACPDDPVCSSGAAYIYKANTTVVDCNAPETIVPSDAPVSFTATASDEDGSLAVEIMDFDCYSMTSKGKRIDKTGECVIEVQGETINIVDSGGIDNHITWTLSATDSCDKTTEKTCEIMVESKE